MMTLNALTIFAQVQSMKYKAGGVGILGVALLVAFGFGIGYAIRARRPGKTTTEKPAMAAPTVTTATPPTLPAMSLFSIGRSIAGCWMAPTAVMTAFVFMSGLTKEHPGPVIENGAISFDPWTTKLTDVRVNAPEGHLQVSNDQANQVLITRASENAEVKAAAPAAESDLAANRPKWTNGGDRLEGDVRQIVISSKLWSTEEEAKNELQAKASEIVREDFSRRHQGLINSTSFRFLSDERLIKVAVKERYLERSERDFGTFSSPMNRLWWLVEVSPIVRTELYPSWKSAVVQNRVLMVGTTLALFTLLVNSFGLFFTLKQQPKLGWFRAAAASGMCTAAWSSAGLFVAYQIIS